MGQESLVNEQIDAGEEFLRDFNDYVSIAAAFQIKLLNSSDPLAAEVVEIRNRYPLKIPTRYTGSSIAGLAIDGAYIYPPITAPSSAP
jgi:hypothetical protein